MAVWIARTALISAFITSSGAPIAAGEESSVREEWRIPPAYAVRFQSRSDLSRRASRFGSTTERAVESALDWLVRHSNPEGGWDSDGFESRCVNGRCGGPGDRDADVGVTGLACQALLGFGVVPDSPGDRGATLGDGLRWLMRYQHPNGFFAPPAKNGKVHPKNVAGETITMEFLEIERLDQCSEYGQAMALGALSEAYGLTGREEYRSAVQRGFRWMDGRRGANGGWTYGNQRDLTRSSLTGWVAQAYLAAEWAGIPTTATVMADALAGMRRLEDSQSGRIGYAGERRRPNRIPELMDKFPSYQSESLTAMFLAISKLDAGSDDDERDATREALLQLLMPDPNWRNWTDADGRADFMYFYWGTLAFWHRGGRAWIDWQKGIGEFLPACQQSGEGKCHRGSWDPAGPWGPGGGRVYSTSILALCLQTPYRWPRSGRFWPTRARFSLGSAPAGAAVFVNGDFVGSTPLRNHSVPPGRLRVRVSSPGFKDVEFQHLAIAVGSGVPRQPETVILEKGPALDGVADIAGLRVFQDGLPCESGHLRPGGGTALLVREGHLPVFLGLTAGGQPVSGATLTWIPGKAFGPGDLPLPPPSPALEPASLPWYVERDGGRFISTADGAVLVLVPPGPDGEPALLVDQVEWTSWHRAVRAGTVPPEKHALRPESGFSLRQAKALARAVGRRLPTTEEWRRVQAAGTMIGNSIQRGFRVEERYPGRPLELSGDPARMNGLGIYDLDGNLAEWAVEDDGGVLMGGSWLDSRRERVVHGDSAPMDAGLRFVVTVPAFDPGPAAELPPLEAR